MGAYATGGPLNARGYVAGVVNLADHTVAYNLLALIQAQIDANANGAAYELQLQSDATGSVYIGSAKNLVGVLSTTNYGYVLPIAAAGPPLVPSTKVYRSSFPGSHCPLGDIWILGSADNTKLHVELFG